jgi:hypothetical protein
VFTVDVTDTVGIGFEQDIFLLRARRQNSVAQ